MEVQLGIILREKRFELLLGSRLLHTFLVNMLVFLLAPQLEVFVLVQVAILK